MWETAVDTMLLSYCHDCESHGGVAQARTSPELAAALGSVGQKNKGGQGVAVLQVQAAPAGGQFIAK